MKPRISRLSRIAGISNRLLPAASSPLHLNHRLALPSQRHSLLSSLVTPFTLSHCSLYQCLPAQVPPSRSSIRTFTTSRPRSNWLGPKSGERKATQKGRCRVPTGGSTRGTTVVWGDYGLRLRDHHRRVTSRALAIGAEAIRKRLRGEKFRLFTRVAANVAVFTRGNETRMGKGKGRFSYWAARVAVSQIVFEVSGQCHEQVVRDAMRLAAIKMPGQYEFVKRGDPPVMGITKMTEGVTFESLKRPWKALPGEVTAGRVPASTPGPVQTASTGISHAP